MKSLGSGETSKGFYLLLYDTILRDAACLPSERLQ